MKGSMNQPYDAADIDVSIPDPQSPEKSLDVSDQHPAQIDNQPYDAADIDVLIPDPQSPEKSLMNTKVNKRHSYNLRMNDKTLKAIQDLVHSTGGWG